MFPDDILDRSSFVSRLIALLSKKISIPKALSWRVVDDYGLTAHLESFLTHVLWDSGGGLQRVLLGVFLTICFDKDSKSSTPSSRIFGGQWVTRLALSYDVDTSRIVPMPIRDISTTALGKMQVLVRGVGRQWRILKDNIVDLVR
uniref:Uncharacterized protein n=1 Tax=Lactuca sativa TaxID=4236 RepID=A0A9R1VC83_LACSA|nr:hypothetical protein LSAT_V11C600316960 [Lactuca sativa]